MLPNETNRGVSVAPCRQAEIEMLPFADMNMPNLERLLEKNLPCPTSAIEQEALKM